MNLQRELEKRQRGKERRERGTRKRGLKGWKRRGVVKGACEHGSGDGNSSLVFTMSPETHEFLGQCVQEHMLTQTNSFTLVADFRRKRGPVIRKHRKLKINVIIHYP